MCVCCKMSSFCSHLLYHDIPFLSLLATWPAWCVLFILHHIFQLSNIDPAQAAETWIRAAAQSSQNLQALETGIARSTEHCFEIQV